MTALRLRAGPRGPIGWAALALASAVGVATAVSIAGPMVGIAIIVGVLLLAGVVVAPGTVFAAYLLIAFYKGGFQQYSPIDITVLLALANALQVVPLLFGEHRWSVSRTGIALWLALGVLVLAGILYAPDQSLAMGDAITYWALVVVPMFPAAIRVGADPRYVGQFLWTFFGMGIVTVLLGLANLSGSDRLVVLGMNTIQVGRAALLVPLLGITWVLPQRRLIASIVVVALVPASLVVAIASGSRGPLLALAIVGLVVAVVYVTRPHAARWRLIGGGVAIALTSVVVLSVAAPDLPGLSLERFANLADFVQGGPTDDQAGAVIDTSAAARVRLFQQAVDIFEARPLVGAGTSGFAALNIAAVGPEADPYPHNAVLQVAAEYGLVGLVLFVGLVALGLLRPLPGRYTSLAVHALFAFFVLNAMVSGDIFTDRETLGLLLLIFAIEAPGAREASTGGSIPGEATPTSAVSPPEPAMPVGRGWSASGRAGAVRQDERPSRRPPAWI